MVIDTSKFELMLKVSEEAFRLNEIATLYPVPIFDKAIEALIEELKELMDGAYRDINEKEDDNR